MAQPDLRRLTTNPLDRSPATSRPGLLASTFPHPRFYGWKIVALCFLASGLSCPGQSFVIALYVDHLIDALGFTRMELSSLYAAMTLTAAFSLSP